MPLLRASRDSRNHVNRATNSFASRPHETKLASVREGRSRLAIILLLRVVFLDFFVRIPPGPEPAWLPPVPGLCGWLALGWFLDDWPTNACTDWLARQEICKPAQEWLPTTGFDSMERRRIPRQHAGLLHGDARLGRCQLHCFFVLLLDVIFVGGAMHGGPGPLHSRPTTLPQ